MIFIQDAEVTPTQQAWLRSASPLDGARFLHSAPIKILCLYVLVPGPKLERRFMPTVQGVRLSHYSRETLFISVEDAQATGESILLQLRQIYGHELDTPLDIEGLGLIAAPTEEFDQLEDMAGIDLSHVLTEVQWQKQLRTPGETA